MPVGRGPQSESAERLLAQTPGATLCLVIVMTEDGAGFDIAVSHPAAMRQLSEVLRHIATTMDTDEEQITAELIEKAKRFTRPQR